MATAEYSLAARVCYAVAELYIFEKNFIARNALFMGLRALLCTFFAKKVKKVCYVFAIFLITQ